MEESQRIELAQAGGLQQAAQLEPEYAVIDLRIGHESGLAFAEQLHKLDENTRMVILTGYASVATAALPCGNRKLRP